MRTGLRRFLWILAVPAVLFMGILIYSLFHLDEAHLNAEVSKSSTFVSIRNPENMDWNECVATVDQGNKTFKSATFSLAAGRQLTILLGDFTAEDGLRFDPVRYVPREVDLECGPFGHQRIAAFKAN